jgi:hypothetical protein
LALSFMSFTPLLHDSSGRQAGVPRDLMISWNIGGVSWVVSVTLCGIGVSVSGIGDTLLNPQLKPKTRIAY